MRLLCVIDNLGSGGAQRQMVSIGCGLKKRGHTVEFFVYYPQDHYRQELQEAEIPITLCRKSSRFSMFPAFALRRLVRQGRFDCVLAFLETPVLYAELGCVGMRGVRVVAGERSMVDGGIASPGYILKANLHRLADLVVTNSHFHRRWMAKRFPFLERKLATVWNGVNVEKFSPAPTSLVACHGLRLAAVGRISQEKNLARLVRALAACKTDGVAVSLTWFGRVDDPLYHRGVVQLIESAGIEDLWVWGGEISAVAQALVQYDALILPSLWEGLPNVVCEALACGLPVLASDVGDNGLLVEDNVRGLLFDPRSPRQIADAIKRFAQFDGRRREMMARAARDFAVDRLALETCVAEYERMLECGGRP